MSWIRRPRGGARREPARLAATPRARPTLPPPRALGLVALGGSAGAVARVALSGAFPAADGALPYSTLAENLSGAFLLALLLTLLTERLPPNRWARPLLGTGLLGAYTTFATVAVELERRLSSGYLALAAAYLAVTVLGGLLAALAGVAAGRALPPRPGGRGAR